MRTAEEEQAAAEMVSKIAEAANLTVAVADTPVGVFYLLVDDQGNLCFRFGPDSNIFNADNMTEGEVLNRLDIMDGRAQ
jgi:ABC-type Fe3+-hydroxamate transport system substrate-binding protein